MSKSLATILGMAGVGFLVKGTAELRLSNFLNSVYTEIMKIVFKEEVDPVADLWSGILSLVIGAGLVIGAIYVATHGK